VEKDFDAWGTSKKQIDCLSTSIYAHTREVWWCSLGLNIGVETDGKHAYFDRPVIVMKSYNKDSVLVLPLTSKRKEDSFHFEIRVSGHINWAKLSQARVISTKRMQRKIGTVGESDFNELKAAWIALL
jgi:mRNA interferase MazF